MSLRNREDLDKERRLIRNQVAIEKSRLAAYDDLQKRGHFSALEYAELQSELVDYEQSLVRLETQITTAQQRAQQASLQADLKTSERFSQLQARKSEVVSELETLRFELSTIQLTIAQSEIRSPVAGTLSDWTVQTGAVFQIGQEIGQVTGELERYDISLSIPDSLIDQIYDRQPGIVQFPTLPQRELPRTDIKIKSIADASTVSDVDGTYTYSGIAEFDGVSFEELKAFLGEDYHLALDLPVMVLLEGRKLTAWTYFTEPFLQVLRRAFEA